MKTYQQFIQTQIAQKKSLLCVGLDPLVERMPASMREEQEPLLAFNRRIVEATQAYACCYKLNLAFYTAWGASGYGALAETVKQVKAAGVPVILDAKWGDIGHTAEQYAISAFERLEVDAVTVNPYMGEDSIAPFRQYADKGVYILCFTSNASRQDFQTLSLHQGNGPEPLFLRVAEQIAAWNQHGNLGAVVGATAPDEMKAIRARLGEETSILCPGVGAQGGSLESVIAASGADRTPNLVVNVSRGIIHASQGEDFAEAAREAGQKFAADCARLIDWA